MLRKGILDLEPGLGIAVLVTCAAGHELTPTIYLVICLSFYLSIYMYISIYIDIHIFAKGLTRLKPGLVSQSLSPAQMVID